VSHFRQGTKNAALTSARSCVRACTLLIALAVGAVPSAQSGLLTSVTPMGASSLATINIVGTGFDATASKNEVSFVPSSGATLTALGTAIATVDAATGSRRLTVKVPAGLPVGSAALRVRNLTTGGVSQGKSLDVIALTLPETTSVPAGATNRDIRITGSPNTHFVVGNTQVSFGTGVTVNKVTVQSDTTLLANVSVPETTAPSVRTVQVTSAQIAVLPGVFTITAAGPPPNHNPTANAGGPYSGLSGASISFSGSGSDSDAGDTLNYAWSFGDGATGAGATATHSYTTAGSYTATLTVTDGHGGSATSSAAVTIAAPPPPPNHNPTASAGGPYSGVSGNLVSFSGSGSDPDASDTLSFAWDFGDGANAAGPNPAHAYAATGAYTAKLTVTDNHGAAATATAAVTITAPPVNQPPHVAINPAALTITLPNNVSLPGTATDDGLPAGSSLTTQWSKVSGPGTVKFASVSTPVSTATFDVPGTYVLRLTASDSALSNSADVTVTVFAAIVNHRPVASPGPSQTSDVGIGVAFDGSGSSDPDGDALTFAWSFGDQTSSIDRKPFHIYQTAGTFAVSLVVTDSHGSASEAVTTTATITAAPDRVPPIVKVNGPKEALPGAHVTVSADATDNVGVQSVTLDVNGSDPVEIQSAPYQRVITVPDFAAPGTQLKIGATARDTAGNTGTAATTLTVVSEPDTEKPVVNIKAPQHAAPGTVLQVVATATDNVGVASVGLSANSIVIGSLTAPPYEATYVIPPDAAVGSTVVVSAQAVDSSNNRATASASIEIVQAPDTTPPSLVLNAPATAASGASVPVSATVSDLGGVASVRFSVDGTRVTTISDPPYQMMLSVAPGLPSGARIHVEARAVDFAGLEAADARDVQVISPGEGVLTGEVYDDGSGLPVEGAIASLHGTDGRGLPYSQTATTDAHGRYILHGTDGSAVVQISKPGWSTVSRATLIKSNTAIEVVDARITAALAGGSIDRLAGGTVTGDLALFLDVWQREVSAAEDPSLGSAALGAPNVTLAIPPGALTASSDVTLTPLSRQSLPGLLPTGWTPIDIIDIGPSGIPLASAATLSAPSALNVKAGTVIVFARWDEDARAWRTVATSPLSQDKGLLTGAVSATGQYAWLVADSAPAAPPAQTAGALLTGVSAALITPSATGLVVPQPQVLFYKPGVRSIVRGTVANAPAPLASGTIVHSRITESYQFYSQAEMHLEPVEQDLVLYQIPGGPAPVTAAGFAVSPSQTFEAVTLDKGVITVELRAPEEAIHEVPVIGTSGGTVTGTGGERLDLAAGSLATTTPVELRSIPLSELGVQLPAGFEFISANAISFASVLTTPATFSIQRPAQASDGDLFLFTRLQELGGQTRFVLVGVGKLVNDRLISDRTLAGTDVTFEGLRVPARYIFLRATTPTAFAAGTVTGASATFAGALVSSNTNPVVSLSQSTGRYISAIGIGAVTVSALDLLKTDAVSAQLTSTTPRQVLPLDLALVARPPTVTSVSPANGALNVPLGDPIVIHFSSAIDPATATLQTVQLTSSAGVVVGSLSLTSGNTTATLRPVEALKPNTAYTLTISQTIADPFGRQLPSVFVSSFVSLDTVAPLPPAAGGVSATIPGADGKTTITATQGTAGAHDTVVVRNITRGTTTPIVLDPNGGFVVIVPASLTDKLQLIITDPAGNQTVVAVPRFHRDNADGSASEAVQADGGRVQGPGGVVVDVPAGAFPDGAIITLKPVSEADFPVQLTAEQKQFFGYTGGLQLDLGGQTPAAYLNVSIPAHSNDTLVDRWVVGQVLTTNGQPPILNIADTARLIDGRVSTSSPPCPGVTGSGVYGFLKSARPLGVTFTQMSGDAALQNALQMTGDDASQASPESSSKLPYSVSLDEQVQAALGVIPKRVCLPVLSGRVTVSPNRFVVPLPPVLLTATDEDVVVTNNATGRPSTVRAYPPFEAGVSVDGSATDPIAIEVHSREMVGGTLAEVTRTLGAADCVANNLPDDCLKPVARSFVMIELARTVFRPDDQSILVQNTRTKARATLAFAAGRRFSSVRMIVEGTPADTYTAQVVGAGGITRQVTPAAPTAYPSGSGNLLIRAVPGAIDPTRADIQDYNQNRPSTEPPLNENAGVRLVRLVTKRANGSGQLTVVRTDVILDVAAGNTSRVITGGFMFALDANITDTFLVQVEYENGTTDEQTLPNFRVTVKDTQTQAVKKQVVGPAPSSDDTLEIEVFGADAVVPTLLTDVARFVDFDPSRAIVLAFSAPLLDENLFHFAVFDGVTGQRIAGHVSLSQRDKVLTFIPDQPLELDRIYRISLVGLTDLLGRPLAVRTIPLATYSPRKLSTFQLLDSRGVPVPFGDLAVSRPLDPSGKALTTLVAIPSIRGVAPVANIVNVTDPSNPTKMGQTSSYIVPKRILVRQDTIVTVRKQADGSPMPVPSCQDHVPGAKFSGDLAVVSSYTTNQSSIAFIDVTNPSKPCELGAKVLTANPETQDATNQHGTFKGVGAARSVALIEHSSGFAAFMAVAEIGVLAVDVGNNIPEVNYSVRQAEGLYSGDYRDVVAIGNRLFAANNAFDAPASLDVFDANLSLITSVGLTVKPRRMIASEGVRVDRNADGQITTDEIFDLVFAAGVGGVDIVDVTDPANPTVIGHVASPGIIRELAVGNGGRRLFAGGDRGPVAGSGDGFFVFDVSNPFSANGSRTIYQVAYPEGIGGIQSDDPRGLAYVASGRGIDVYSLEPPNLSGVVKYVSYEADRTIGLTYVDPAELPVRGVAVELRDANDTVIATTNTTGTGYYSFVAPKNITATIVVKAALGDPKQPNVTVRDNQHAACPAADPDCNLYTVRSAVLIGASTVTKDITLQSGWNNATRKYSGSRDAAPFSILDTILDAQTFVRGKVGNIALPPLIVNWSPLNDGGDVGYHRVTGTDTGTITLNGAADSDTDEYDDGVILHEWAHYFHSVVSRNDSPASKHDDGDILDPATAFAEGFATAFAGIVLKSEGKDPFYVDTRGLQQADGSWSDLEVDKVDDSLQRVPGILFFDGYYSEDSIAEVIYDLFDEFNPYDLNSDGTPNPDNVAFGFKPIYEALVATRATPAFTSIFTFLKALKDLYPLEAVDIDKLATAENIGVGDEYGKTNASLYSTLELGKTTEKNSSDIFTGDPLQTYTTFGPITPTDSGNKLLNRALFRFHAPSRGCYAIQATSLGGGFLTIELNLRDVSTNATLLTRLVKFLDEGDHAVRVSAEAAVRFGMRVEQLSLTEANCK